MIIAMASTDTGRLGLLAAYRTMAASATQVGARSGCKHVAFDDCVHNSHHLGLHTYHGPLSRRAVQKLPGGPEPSGKASRGGRASRPAGSASRALCAFRLSCTARVSAQ